jgi:hypothetical protein
MSGFGKRPNQTDYACILLPGAIPIACRVIDRTSRIVCLSVSKPENLPHRFQLVFNNGGITASCEIASFGQDYVLARYNANSVTSPDAAILANGITLGEAEDWKGKK